MPHSPTAVGKHHDPATCYVCARHATAIGIGSFGRRGDGDPLYLCELCLMLIEQIKSVVSFDRYEREAIRMTIERLGAIVEANGPDLSEWEDHQVTEFVEQAILNFGEAIREQIRQQEVPFP